MWVVVSLMLLLLAAFVVLNTEAVQRRVAKKAAAFLSDEIGSTVTVSDAAFSLFNQIILYDVEIDDQQGDTLLYVKELNVKLKLLPMLRNRFVFQHIRIKNMYACLKNDAKNGNNFDFVIEAFKSKDNKPKKSISLNFKSIQLADSRIIYTSNRAAPKGEGIFDVNNLDVSKLNLKLSLDYLNSDSLSVRLRGIDFVEKSGLTVKNISAVLNANGQAAEISNFVLQLPKTDIRTSSLSFEYGSLTNFKHFTDSVDFEIRVMPSDVFIGDFAVFAPRLKNINQKFNISGTFIGSVSKLICPTLKITYGNATQLVGYFKFDGLPDIENTYLTAGISNLTCTKQDAENLIAAFKDEPFQLPKTLQNIEKINFRGETKGYLTKDITAVGNIKTNLGQIDSDFSLKRQRKGDIYEYHGSMKTNKFQLGDLLDNKAMGDITFNLHLNGTKLQNQPADFDIEGLVGSFTYNDYTYNNITLDGHYNHNKFDGKINLDDENGKVAINGLLDFSQALPYYDFTAKVQKLQPAKMKLTEKYPDMVLSFNINTNVRGNNLDNLTGNIYANNIYLKNGDNKLVMKKIELLSDISDSLSSIAISSDFVNGIIEGKYTISTIVSSVQYVASQYIPALSNAKNDGKRKITDNNFDFALKINDADTITDFLNVKWRADSIINVFGYYDDYTQKFRLRGIIPYLTNGRLFLEKINLTCDNPDDVMNLALDFNASNSKNISVFDVYLRLKAKDDMLNTQLQWTNNQYNNGFYAGEVSTSTAFERNADNRLTTNTDILPSNFILSDTLWDILPGNIKTEPEKITLSNIVLSSLSEDITINGIASKSENDYLYATLNKVNLRMLEQFIVMDAIDIDGIVSGKASVSSVLDKPIFQIDIFAKDFAFNKKHWGDVTLNSVWQGEQERLVINGGINDNGKYIADLSGYVYPLNDIDLDLRLNATDLPIDFLQPFLKSVMQNVSGYASAQNLRMVGSLKKPLFEGNIAVRDGKFGIDFLKTAYSFSDTIRMTRNSISFKNITLYDSEKHSGKASGNVRHDLYQNFVFNINGRFTNMLGLNTQRTDNETFYGKVYGTGSLRISGNSRETTFDIGVKTEPHSSLTIPFSAYQTAGDNNFITFVSRNQTAAANGQTRRRARRTLETTSANIKMNLQIEATPDAEIRLIVDPISGDMIKATGSGSLQLSYDRAADFKMYGTYTVSTGSYHFSLQDVIQKEFKIKEGSTISWNGSPYVANIDINAYYPLTAKLPDISEFTAAASSKNVSVRVNCLLKLSGNLTSPNIKFDLEFPGSQNELTQSIKNFINSEDMMNRQMIYLLAMGTFYQPAETNADNANKNSTNQLSSLVSSTLSAQLNSLLSQVSDKFTIGVNYQTSSNTNEEGDAAYSQEYGVTMGGQFFDNKLNVYGEVGYRDDAYAGSNFIGDFDVEYKLGNSGFRLKAYSHSNNKYYLKNSTTQGAGIIYREEFDTFGGLMRGYWDKIFGKKEKQPKIKKE
ncbi:DUF490 domain-containing protein [Bacteroidia bacterium]|nr:DUF490 domain-containing protein [Bacteroidia bacterium]